MIGNAEFNAFLCGNPRIPAYKPTPKPTPSPVKIKHYWWQRGQKGNIKIFEYYLYYLILIFDC